MDESDEEFERWCSGCDAGLPEPVKDKHAIQVCGVCGTEQPHKMRR